MKIIYLSSSIIPSRTANSVHVMKMCAALSSEGHEVTLVGKKNKSAGDINPFEYYGVKENFKIKKLPWPGKLLGIPLYYILCCRYLKRFDRKKVLVYGRSSYGMQAAVRLGFNAVYESHETPHNKIHYLLEKSIFKSSFFKKLILITHALKDEYLKIYPFLDEKKISVYPDGADPVGEDIEPVSIENQGNKMLVGYTGNLYKGRGMEIIEELSELCPWAVFHIVGGTDVDIKYWKERLGGADNIIFYGFVPPREVPRFLLSFDVLLAPYREKVLTGVGADTVRWMSPLKVFEYMASGKAIIASDLPVLKEVLKDGQNALLAKPGNARAWKDTLERLKDDQKLRKQLGDNARRDIAQNYSWNKRAELIMRDA